MAYEPTLTAMKPAVGGPSVKIVFSSFATGTTSVNLFRYAAGRQMPVGGATGASVSGSAGFIDPEAPFGVQSTYLAEMFGSDGSSLGFTGGANITLSSDSTWVHNPLNPSGAIPVRTAAATSAQVAGQMDANIYYPVGRTAGVAITGPRRGIAAAQVSVYTDTFDDADKLDAMFGTLTGDLTLPPVLCVRIADRFRTRLPRPLFIAVPSPTQTPINPLAGGERILWDLTGPEVDRPSPALAEGLLTRADLDAYYSSRSARDTSYGSRLAMDTDYNLAGYAS